MTGIVHERFHESVTFAWNLKFNCWYLIFSVFKLQGFKYSGTKKIFELVAMVMKIQYFKVVKKFGYLRCQNHSCIEYSLKHSIKLKSIEIMMFCICNYNVLNMQKESAVYVLSIFQNILFSFIIFCVMYAIIKNRKVFSWLLQ